MAKIKIFRKNQTTFCYQTKTAPREFRDLAEKGHKIISEVNVRCSKWLGKTIDYRPAYNYLLEYSERKIQKSGFDENIIEEEFKRLKRKLESIETSSCKDNLQAYSLYLNNYFNFPF